MADSDEEEVSTALTNHNLKRETNDRQSDDEITSEEPPKKETDVKQPNRKRKVHKLSLQQTTDFNEQLAKRGVVYIARIPPRMTPAKLKQLLGVYGTITRLYLEPEDSTTKARRKQVSGRSHKRYKEGWIEFEKKKIAKQVVNALHTTRMSNAKRNVHYGDLWNLKYLRNFSWHHLSEKTAYERRVRAQKLRLETMQAKHETNQFRWLLEQSKTQDHIQQRRGQQQQQQQVLAERPPKKIRQVEPVSEGPSSDAVLLRSLTS